MSVLIRRFGSRLALLLGAMSAAACSPSGGQDDQACCDSNVGGGTDVMLTEDSATTVDAGAPFVDAAPTDENAPSDGDAPIVDAIDDLSAPLPVCVTSIVFSGASHGVANTVNGVALLSGSIDSGDDLIFDVVGEDGKPWSGELAAFYADKDGDPSSAAWSVAVSAGQGKVEIVGTGGADTLCVSTAVTGCDQVEACQSFKASAIPIYARLCPPSGETEAHLRVEATPLGPAIAELPPPATETCAGLAPQATAVIVVDEDHPKTVLDDGTTLLWQVDEKGCEAVSVLPGQPMMLSAYALTGCGLSEPKQAAFEGFFSEWHDGWWADDLTILGTFGYRTLSPGAAHLLFRWHLRPLYIDNMGLAPIYFYLHPSEPGACTDPSTVFENTSLTEPDPEGGAPWYPCAGAVDDTADGWPFVAGQCGCGG